MLSWDYSSLLNNRNNAGDSLYSISTSALIGNDIAADNGNSLDGSGPLLVDGYVISYHLAQNYIIDDANIGTEDWQSVTISSSSATNFMLKNLRCGSEYVTRIEAFNEMGSGRPSEMIRFSTLGSRKYSYLSFNPISRPQIVVNQTLDL